MNKIKIKIEGECGVGKSAIGVLIANTLELHGFDNIDCKVIDDVADAKKISWIENNPKRIDSIKADADIEILEEYSRKM